MSFQMHQTESTLRGGGSGPFRKIHLRIGSQLPEVQGTDYFFDGFNSYVQKISSKAEVAASSYESQEIMIAIQWFIIQEENIYELNKNAQYIEKCYDLILEGIQQLLTSCLIYLKTDSFKCFYILQITASLSKVMYSYYLKNDGRRMKYDLQQELLKTSDKPKQQMEIEKNDLIQNQMEIFLLLTKTSFELAPTDKNENNEILLGCLGLLYKIYDHNQKRKQYEVYYQIDMLQWEIISYFRKEKEQNLADVISQFQTINEKLIKCSNDWYDHYFWVEMIGKILSYNPTICKNRLKEVGIDGNEVWQDYIKKKNFNQYKLQQRLRNTSD